MAKTSFLEEVTFNCINQFFDSLKKANEISTNR